MFVTRGAVALPGEDVADLAGAAVWGLVRSAQSEDPGPVRPGRHGLGGHGRGGVVGAGVGRAAGRDP
ncbi:SpnB-like Rossmann fold domain-containing protein [Streptomyces sp. GLT-R25]